ncbi:hypothetical protein IJS77_04425 [bacterium]|nr:hypothetical protein [bacterium]
MSSFQKYDDYLSSVITRNSKTLIQDLPENKPIAPKMPLDLSIHDDFVLQKKKNGIFERAYDGLKNITGLGFGSKKAEKRIEEYNNGKLSKEDIEKDLERYRKSQKNAEQTFGNVVSAGVSLGAFFWGKNKLNEIRARNSINALTPFQKKFKDSVNETIKILQNSRNRLDKRSIKIFSFIKSVFKSNKKALAAAIPVLAVVGGYTKVFVLKLNRIGSKEFSVDKNLKKTDKNKYKEERKKVSRASWKNLIKNFATGAFNGAFAPVTVLGGGLVGVPAYIAGVLGVKYLNSGEKDKSLNGFVKSFSDNYVMNSLGAAALAIIGLRKARYSSVLQKNLKTVTDNLKNVELLNLSEYSTSKTGYDTIRDLLLESPNITRIINDGSLSPKQRIQKLINENIFAAKFAQTYEGSSEAIFALKKYIKEHCPETRDINQAQEVINNLLGSAKYKVEKLLGTGTVAETYLAKDASGKEVCIKILRDGISTEKILKDKEAFINMITLGKPINKLSKDENYLIKLVED